MLTSSHRHTWVKLQLHTEQLLREQPENQQNNSSTGKDANENATLRTGPIPLAWQSTAGVVSQVWGKGLKPHIGLPHPGELHWENESPKGVALNISRD